jgi:peptidoglycan/xylan/chitin deacetylase (PgdA/CDA1 family)
VKTLLYGTVLPAPPVGEAFPDRLRAIDAAGHELGIHGWDHIGWQNRLHRMPVSRIRDAYARACDAFERCLGRRPRATAAPGWQCSAASLGLLDELGFDYASDCRGELPFYPRAGERTHRVLQIPTTLATSDELLGSGSLRAAELSGHYAAQLRPGALHVLCIHAEAEGMLYAPWFVEFLARARELEVQFRTLGEIARDAGPRAPALGVVLRRLPGRAGEVACAIRA